MKDLTIVYKRTDYLEFILGGLNQNVEKVCIESREGLLSRMCHLLLNGRTLTPKRGLGSYITLESKKKLSDIKSCKVLVLGAIDFRLSNVIWRCLPCGIEKNIWLWNEIDKSNPSLQEWKFAYNKKHGVRTFSYNLLDVNLYGLTYAHQVYRYVDDLFQNRELNCDCYWVGRPKGRLSELNSVQRSLESLGFVCDFRIIEKKEDYIGYVDNLRLISSSRCLLDLYSTTNEGISLRVLEALFFKKKLITTNRFVKRYDFYRRENIFIWGEDDTSHLKRFMESEFLDVEKEIVDKYDINNWIKNF